MNGTAERGLSLMETLVVMVLLLIILMVVYFMIVHYGHVSTTEHSRIRLQQESRFVIGTFATELKSAGAILTLAHSVNFLAAAPHFNGIYPLNNDDFPDGMIVASGDPAAVTRLVSPFNFSLGHRQLYVENILSEDGSPLWQAGDRGVVLGQAVDPSDPSRTIGYYAFQVTEVDPASRTLSIREEAVYYSGLLNTANYVDYQTETGNMVTYDKNAPVVKLAGFSIYLFRQVHDPFSHRDVRQLVRVVDARNQADVLGVTTTADAYVVSENIWDMQIAYIAYPDFPDTTSRVAYFDQAGGGAALPDLLDDIRGKRLKEVGITFVMLTDEYGGTGERSLFVPPQGDRAVGETIPPGKYTYKVMSLFIEPKNFNIVI